MGQFGVGQGIKRLEDVRLLRGEGRYLDDVNLDGQAHAVFVRSPHAHAEITSIDTEDAAAVEGVLAIFTIADLDADGIGTIPCLAPMKGIDGEPARQPPRPALAKGRVRHVGEAVALVVAETQEAAEEAAELVMVDYEPLQAVISAPDALAERAIQLHDAAPGNLALHWRQDNGANIEDAFAKAAKVATVDLINNRIVVNSLEPRGAIGDYDPQSERLTLVSGSQGIFRLKGQLSENIFKVPEEKLHIITPDVGGGFGMKIFCYPEQVCVLFAARRLQRPVKWTSSRGEAFQSDIQGRDHVTRAEMAMDAEGHFLGLRVRTQANLGAYLSNFSTYIPTGASTQMFTGLYKIPAIDAEVRCAFSNTVPVDAYRGAGRPEAAYLMERLVDEAGRVAGLDAREIRLRNFVQPEDLPYNSGMGPVYDSGDYPRLLKQATKLADWEGFAQRRAEARKQGKLLGIGLASYVEACSGMGQEEARLTLDEDGGITLVIGTMTNGQGHHTAYAQLLNDKLGVDPEKVRMIQGDSDIVKKGGGTGGSRSLLMGGVAINRGADLLIEEGRKLAGQLLEAATADIEFVDGTFSIVGTDRRVSLEGLAKALGEGSIPGADDSLKATGDYTAEALTYPNGTHVCELEVDEDTGVTKVLRYLVVDDFGTVVNPMMAAGQVHGGAAQGLGQALLEHTVYDEEGQLLTASLMDYCLPRADDMPPIEVNLVEDLPCKTNPMGVKGAGEAGAIGAPPAIINALIDALSPIGPAQIDMPATPEKVWRAIQEARTAGRAAAE
ncbi:xanthine dehydrogenase family protein molybdopterin-binding subunit [Aquibaculum arenosum]|uniref:Xanthine dehydrogenase family protein molybdopterin-binding subunit n=1 Tax=Aquibaculum arenosum TaxID=3032591 RepID=A0ABT5YP51_9PROT|nr:xanthine dehydrogenase family protein molybdopterin-binding subunit [Fodinicurvata sp. CAU 1616]MDF2096728.1 xanthine dehydrogenase family protein molybdopterin-binding subunit [Fodinicurvata sp. CAU 1616]